jgi:hypothetical protein
VCVCLCIHAYIYVGEDEGQRRWSTAVTARVPQGVRCLQTIIVDKEFREKGTFDIWVKKTKEKCLAKREDYIQVKLNGKDTWVPRIWDPPTWYLGTVQFYRLAHLYPYMLAEETRACRRYSHVVRMRTDAIQESIWEGIQTFHEIIPPLNQVVAGPRFDNLRTPSHMLDSFWIASRAAASSAFVGFALSLEKQVDRKKFWEYFNCHWPPKPRTGGLFCDVAIEQVFGPSSIWPEIRKYSKVQSWHHTHIRFCGEQLC